MDAEIYTDGSSLGNPGPGGFCALLKLNGETVVVRGGEPQTTNNRMEMCAIIAGLHALKRLSPETEKCAVYSDSQLIINTLTKNWKRKKNTDLWAKIDALIKKYSEIEWNWIRGHAGHKENTQADKIAVEEAKKQMKKLMSTT